MRNTELLYARLDDARGELAALDRHIAVAKDDIRAVVQRLEQQTRVADAGGKCFGTILEAIDDMMADERDEIRDRAEDVEVEIADAEWGDLQRSSPVVL